MYYLWGLILAILCGISSPIYRKATEGVSLGKFLLIYSMSNALLSIPFYILVLGKHINFNAIINLPKAILIYLVVYMVLRIVSNQAQSILLKNKNIDINVLSIILAQTCFLTILINFVSTKTINTTALIGMTIAVIGAVIIAVDFKKFTFYFALIDSLLIVVAFIASGTKPNMGHELLRYLTPETLCILEYLNYLIVYLVLYRREAKELITSKDVKLENFKKYRFIFVLSIISFFSMYAQYNAFGDVVIATITSLATPIFTAIFSYVLLKVKISKKTAIGIAITVLGITISKVF